MTFFDLIGKPFDEVAKRLADYVRLVRQPRLFADLVAIDPPREHVRRIVIYVVCLTLYMLALGTILGDSPPRSSLLAIDGLATLFFLSVIMLYPAAIISSFWFDKRPKALTLLTFITAVTTLSSAVVFTPLALFLATERYEFKVATGLACWLITVAPVIWFGYSFGIRRWRRFVAGVTYFLLILTTTNGLAALSKSVQADSDEIGLFDKSSPYFDPIGYEAFELGAIGEMARDDTAYRVLRRAMGVTDDASYVLDFETHVDFSATYVGEGGGLFSCQQWVESKTDWVASLASRRDSVEARLSRAEFRHGRRLLRVQLETLAKTEYAVSSVDSLCTTLSGARLRSTHRALQRVDSLQIYRDKLSVFDSTFAAEYDATNAEFQSTVDADTALQIALQEISSASPEKLHAAESFNGSAPELESAIRFLDSTEYRAALRARLEACRRLTSVKSATLETLRQLIAEKDTVSAAQDEVLDLLRVVNDAVFAVTEERAAQGDYEDLLIRLADWRLSFWF